MIILQSLFIAPVFLPAFALDNPPKALVCTDVKKEEVLKQLDATHDRVLKKVNLTAAQKDQIKKIRAERGELIFAQVQHVRTANTDVIVSLESNLPNEILRERVTNLEKERTALMMTKLDLILAVRDILTPEQKLKALGEIKHRMRELCE